MFSLTPKNRRNYDLFDYFNDLDKEFFGSLRNDIDFSQFRTDIIDEGDHYLLKADLPGFPKENIKIDLDDNTLTIQAQHNEQKEDKEKDFIRRERRTGLYKRSFDVSNIQVDGIEADYKDGVLEMKLPKLEISEPKTRRIELK